MARRINLYRRSFREYAQRLKQNAGDEKLQLGWLKDDEVAVLSFHEVAYEKSFYLISIKISILIIAQLVLFILAFVRFLRYDVR